MDGQYTSSWCEWIDWCDMVATCCCICILKIESKDEVHSWDVTWNLKLIIFQRNLLFQELHFQAFQGCSISNIFKSTNSANLWGSSALGFWPGGCFFVVAHPRENTPCRRESYAYAREKAWWTRARSSRLEKQVRTTRTTRTMRTMRKAVDLTTWMKTQRHGE